MFYGKFYPAIRCRTIWGDYHMVSNVKRRPLKPYFSDNIIELNDVADTDWPWRFLGTKLKISLGTYEQLISYSDQLETRTCFWNNH